MQRYGVNLFLPSKILLLLLSFVILNFNVQGQSGLIKAMSFEDAEYVAINSIRRASGIAVKQIDFTDDEKKDNKLLQKKIKNDKYARNCLDRKMLDCIFKHGGNCPIENSSATKPIDFDKLKIQLEDGCFPFKRMRLTDSLEFLGITDEFRLAALRSYIVRNAELGVKSVWVSDDKLETQFFVISGKQLEDIETKTTVLELALKIQSAAALPFLSGATAERLVRNCRDKVMYGDKPLEGVEVSIKKDLEKGDLLPTAAGSSKKVLNKKGSELELTVIEKFVICLEYDVLKDGDPVVYDDKDVAATARAKDAYNLKRYKYGVRSLRIVNNEGDNRHYYLTKDFQSTLKAKIEGNCTYKTLIENLVKSAAIPASDDFLAARIVFNAMLSIVKEKEKDIPKIADARKDSKAYSAALKSQRVSDILLRIRALNCPSVSNDSLDEETSVKNTLEYLCVNPENLPTKLETESDEGLSSYLVLNCNEYLVNLGRIVFSRKPKFDPEKLFTKNTTIEEVINKVEEAVENKRELIKDRQNCKKESSAQKFLGETR